MFKAISTLALASLFLAACGQSPTRPDAPLQAGDAKAVWADDGSLVAVAKAGPSGNTHRILLYTPEGRLENKLTEIRPFPARNLYFMHSAGYVVIESHPGPGLAKFDRVGLDGREITIIETRQSAEQLCADSGGNASIATTVIPSPQGDTLAYVYSPVCGEVTVEFLRARDLRTQESYQLAIEHPAQATWMMNGELVIGLADERTAWKLAPGTPPTPTDYPGCFYPNTSSSPVSLDARRVDFADEQIRITDVEPGQAFGCQ